MAYVLILTAADDTATDEVITHLTDRGIPHKRLNTERYPFSSCLTFEPEKIGRDGQIVFDGESVLTPSSIWYRRMRTPPRPEEMQDDGIYKFCSLEARASLMGSVLGLQGRWMSYPSDIWQAEHKPFQLVVARQFGLQIPATVVTNDPDTVRRFFKDRREIIVKPVSGGQFSWEGGEFVVFTSQVLEHHLQEVESAQWSPAIYQALIPKRFDLRITIVGQKILSVDIEYKNETSAMHDSRRVGMLPMHPITLPFAIGEALFRMMDSLRLRFAAIDMIQTPEGDFVFLEINPNGQWLWLDDNLQLGISEAVAAWLA